MKKVGPKTMLTDELFGKIKQSILDGNNLRETAITVFDSLEEFKNLKKKEIEEEKANFIQKLYNWNYENYLNISDKIENWKRDRKLMLAEGVIEEMLTMPVIVLKRTGDDDEQEEYTATEPSLVKIKQDTAKFVAETLGKNNYAKRNELTGAGGKELMPVSEEIKNKVNTSIDEYLKGYNK